MGQLARQCYLNERTIVNFSDLKIADVLDTMTRFQPDWMFYWADQRDLISALQLPPERQRDWLITASRSRVEAVLRAAWATATEAK